MLVKKNRVAVLFTTRSDLLSDLDSNQDKQYQKLSYYPYTIGQSPISTFSRTLFQAFCRNGMQMYALFRYLQITTQNILNLFISLTDTQGDLVIFC